MDFERIGFQPASILLPREAVSPETWACVACDQYTSEPAYWQQADALVGAAPSALRLILPECYLSESQERIPRIHAEMRRYLEEGVLTETVHDGFVLCQRETASGTRLGLVCAVDLEQYSYHREDRPLIRPTEQTVASRLPPRMAIRRGAPLELTHIMILIDDPDRTVLEPMAAEIPSLRKLYDFSLMLGGGHLRGYAIEDESRVSRIGQAMNALLDRLIASTGEKTPMLLAMGDGNHSLATAKACWEEIRETLPEEERATHPARYALCEIVNIHDEALLFEPIHRLVTGTDADTLLRDWQRYAAGRGMTLAVNTDLPSPEGAHHFELISAGQQTRLDVLRPDGAIPCATIQTWLDDFLSRHPEASIDYIHGERSLRTLSEQPHSVGFLLPPIDKHTFFHDVSVLGVLPRKTFSMGEANEKRYYMESRIIQNSEFIIHNFDE